MFTDSYLSVVGTITAWPGVAVGGQSIFDILIQNVIDRGGEISSRFQSGCLAILGVTVAIRLFKSMYEALFDDSIVGGVSDALNVVVVGVVLMMGITHVDEISSTVWAVANETMALMSLSSGSDVSTIAGSMMRDCWGIMVDIFNMYFPPEESRLKKFVDWLTAALTGGLFLHVLMGILVTLMAAVYALIIALQLVVGVLQVTIGLGFLPVTLAFYPIIETWAKNALAQIASGIAHLGVCAFLISLVSAQARGLADQLANGGFTVLGEQMGFVPDAGNKMVASLGFGVFLLVLGLSSAKAVGFATAIFGSVGGMIGRTAAGGSGGKGAGSKAGEKGGAAGKEAVQGFAKEGAKSAASSAVRGAAHAGAAGATAGTSAALSAGAEAAQTAATQGMKAAGVDPVASAMGYAGAAAEAAANPASRPETGGKDAGGKGAGAGAGAGRRPGSTPTATAGEKAGMAAALIGAVAAQKMRPAVSAAKSAGASVAKAGMGLGGKGMAVAKAAPAALMRAQRDSTVKS